jgi:FkbM family methyltransferase
VLIGLDDLAAKYQLEITGVLHVGAHIGQEAESYQRNGIHDVTWIEANPVVLPRLRATVEPLGHRVVPGLVSDTDGQDVDFYLTNNEESSSLLPLGTHAQQHPDVIVTETIRLTTTTLDTLCAKNEVDRFNFLSLDVQGAELMVLRGAADVLRQVDFIYSEVNEERLYRGCALVSEIDDFLTGFRRLETEMTAWGWGDAFYARPEKVAIRRTPGRTNSPSRRRPSPRRAVGERARRLVAFAVAPRFDALEARLTNLEAGMARLQVETAALRQQVDEALDFLRVQHDATRAILDELRSQRREQPT